MLRIIENWIKHLIRRPIFTKIHTGLVKVICSPNRSSNGKTIWELSGLLTHANLDYNIFLTLSVRKELIIHFIPLSLTALNNEELMLKIETKIVLKPIH